MGTPKRIIVAGAGWYGCHIAIELSKAGRSVLLLERESQIVSRCSGSFGIRLHRGPHYPRSPVTRQACQSGFCKFLEAYPELVYEHEESIYAYGNLDEQGLPSKVSLEEFRDVCYETKNAYRLADDEISRFSNIATAFELGEPSVAIGAELRTSLNRRLREANVLTLCEMEVQDYQSKSEKIAVTYAKRSLPGYRHVEEVDFLVNATGYQSLRPPVDGLLQSQPPPIQVVYQPCIGFCYEDLFPGSRPKSFIVMDGWYPCMMPLIDNDEGDCQPLVFRDYIVTHGSLTILGSFQRPQDGFKLLQELGNSSVLERIREAVESDMNRFLPSFRSRFVYRGWRGSVLAKPCSKSELRSSLVFARNRVVHIVPGKISDIFSAYDEVAKLIGDAGDSSIVAENGWRYTKDGSVDVAIKELNATKDVSLRSTDSLQTYRDFFID